jgi:hypothetical protein
MPWLNPARNRTGRRLAYRKHRRDPPIGWNNGQSRASAFDSHLWPLRVELGPTTSASGEAQRRLEIWDSEEPETPVTVGRFLDAQVSSFSPLSVGPLQLAAPRATPPAGAGPGRVKTWNPENLKTCRAPQPRRFPGFQISRFPLPGRCARPDGAPPQHSAGAAALVRGVVRGRPMGVAMTRPRAGQRR